MDLLDLDLVKARLAGQTPAVRKWGYAADFAAAMAPGQAIAATSGFIILTGGQPVEIREGSGPLRQLVDVTVSVLTAVKLAGVRGEAGLAALKTPTGQIRGALFGWAHPAAERKFWMGAEGVEDFDAKTGVLVYRQDFEAPVRIQETLP